MADTDEDTELTKYSFEQSQQIGRELLNEWCISTEEGKVHFSEELPHLEMILVEEPRSKATNYLEKFQVLPLLEDLIAKVVYERPDKPIDFLVNEIEELKAATMQDKTTHELKSDVTEECTSNIGESTGVESLT